MQRGVQKWIQRIIILCSAFLFVGCSFRTFSNENSKTDSSQMEDAATTPFGKYPELITYTLGKMSGSNNSNMPEGDTYEDNAYTRYLFEKLNIQNEDVFESTDVAYDNVASMAITADDLPDVMVVSDMEQLQELVEKDMIEDLTQAYEDCASDKIKEIYDSYGDAILDNVTFDGKLMALPETNIENGPSMIWLRKDWMDKLGLNAPETLEDVEYIVSQFIEKDPGGNGNGETVGLVADENLTGEWGYSYEYQTDIVFASYGAFPKRWIRNADGEIVYGSIQDGAKQGLLRLRSMYESGVLDNEFLLRTQDNIIDLICSGKCGSFFGPWWSPNNPLMDAMDENPDADWQPYMIETDEDGSVSYASQNPSYKFIVVRKGYEHPEIVMKMVSVLFDYALYQDDSDNESTKQIKSYYQINVDPTARPLSINVDFSDALSRCYESLTAALGGSIDFTDLGVLEQSYYESCAKYQENPESSTSEEWAAYTSRITACGLIANSDVKQVESVFWGSTETMNKEWWKLQEMESDAYLKIVTGEESVDYFDEFVNEWNENGGAEITEEVRETVDGQN